MRKDLAIGKMGEENFIKILKKGKVKAKINDKKEDRSYYDIKAEIEGKPFTVEVKNDLYAAKSGNIAIEIYNPHSGKKSGLSITKSDLWVHIVDNQHWVTKTKDLKSFVSKTTPFRTVDNAGDGNANILLFKAEDVLPQVFHRIDHLTGKKAKDLITKLVLQG
tara:strand:+ start:1860 stop:2348 length:489 start_codon:yes stop_codon:yes gene_type:complete